MFGNETPFYLKPLPHRGVRRLDAEAAQHYPGYRHPLDFSANVAPPSGVAASSGGHNSEALTQSAAPQPARSHAMPGTSGVGYPKRDPPFHATYNITEAERLRPGLTPTDRLRHEREVEAAKIDAQRERRRQRVAAREAFFRQRQREETARADAAAVRMAGTSMRNMESEGRDTITHVCFTAEAQRQRELRDAAQQHAYFARLKRIDERLNTSGCNILSWQPRGQVVVPPLMPAAAAPPSEVNMEKFE